MNSVITVQCGLNPLTQRHDYRQPGDIFSLLRYREPVTVNLRAPMYITSVLGLTGQAACWLRRPIGPAHVHSGSYVLLSKPTGSLPKYCAESVAVRYLIYVFMRFVTILR